MDRRTFITLAAGALCFASRNAGAAAVASELEEPFPISFEDYRTVDTDFVPRLVNYETDEPRGTIIVDPGNRFLYLVLGDGKAKRYGIGVGREGFGWSGTAFIKRKAKWPSWVPPKDMQLRDKEAAKWSNGMPGGPNNPLGARALYLYQGEVDTLYRIHGTREPRSIGQAVSSGCIRMLNPDIVELFDRVPLGTKVVVLPRESPTIVEAKRPISLARKRTNTQDVVEERHGKDPSHLTQNRRREDTIFGLFGFQQD